MKTTCLPTNWVNCFDWIISLFSEGVSKLKEKARRRKGRGFEEKSKRDNIKDEAMEFDSVDPVDDDGPGPQRCIYVDS